MMGSKGRGSGHFTHVMRWCHLMRMLFFLSLQKRRGDDDLDARRSGSSSSVGTPVQGAMPNTSTSLGGHSTAHRRNGHSRTSSGEAIGMP